MGGANVSACYRLFPHLHHAAHRLLSGMAVVALDDPRDGQEPRLYWGGRDNLAAMLGTVTDSNRNNRYRAVRAALAELREAGAITVIKTGRPGRNTVYRLNLDDLPASRMGDA